MGNKISSSSSSSTSQESSSTWAQRESDHKEAADDRFQTAKGELGIAASGGYIAASEGSKGNTGVAVAGGAGAVYGGALGVRDGMKGWSELEKADDCARERLAAGDRERQVMPSISESSMKNETFESSGTSQPQESQNYPPQIVIPEHNMREKFGPSFGSDS